MRKKARLLREKTALSDQSNYPAGQGWAGGIITCNNTEMNASAQAAAATVAAAAAAAAAAVVTTDAADAAFAADACVATKQRKARSLAFSGDTPIT